MSRFDRVGGTATILVTDLVGSTAMFDRLGDEKAERLLRGHLGQMRDLVRSFGGREVKSTGDGIMAAFPAAWLASECAVAMQRTLHLAREGGAEVPLHIRIGLHSGDTTADRHDYYGIAVAVAARLCDKASADGILMSGVTRGLVGSRGGHSFADAGEWELKGVDEPARAWTLGWEPGQLPPAPPPGLEPKRGRLLGAAAAVLVVAAAGTSMLVAGGSEGPPRSPPVHPPAEIKRLSVRHSGDETAGESRSPAIAGNGSAVVFVSEAEDIVRGDRNGVADVFRLTLEPESEGRGAAELVAPGERVKTPGPSADPSISDDGLTVSFLNESRTRLGKGDPRPLQDVFVHSVDGATSRVSVSTEAELANGTSFDNDIAGNGLFVAFATDATNLSFKPDKNKSSDIFVRDREGQKTNRVNISSDLDEAGEESVGPSLSADGRYVSFTSRAPNLAPGDTNNTRDVFRYDREDPETIPVSVRPNGRRANGPSYDATISGDGNLVAFVSSASNLLGDDAGPIPPSVFLHDVETGETVLISRAVGTGGPPDDGSAAPVISSDGRFVVFTSLATNLVPGDDDGFSDVFLFDRELEKTIRLSVGDGTEANGNSSDPSITDDGRYVVFTSEATNLIAEDTNNRSDVFLIGPLDT